MYSIFVCNSRAFVANFCIECYTYSCCCVYSFSEFQVHRVGYAFVSLAMSAVVRAPLSICTKFIYIHRVHKYKSYSSIYMKDRGNHQCFPLSTPTITPTHPLGFLSLATIKLYSLYTIVHTYIRSSMHIKFNDLVRHFIVDSGLRCFAFTHHHQLHHTTTRTRTRTHILWHTKWKSHTLTFAPISYTRFTHSPRLRFYLLSQFQMCVILKLKQERQD